jgi:predicted DNA-binding transcriptional regulator AlpA
MSGDEPIETNCGAEEKRCGKPEQHCESALLIDVEGVAQMCLCSSDTIRRWASCGRMPKPFKVGTLVRWKRSVILDWIDGGCQPLKGAGNVWR